MTYLEEEIARISYVFQYRYLVVDHSTVPVPAEGFTTTLVEETSTYDVYIEHRVIEVPF